ncbi:MAG TPA: TonB-dependent receptor [Ignavibacteria bacterium]|nr:TonB-dependent receptor [Ignavibacteria bacterium]HMR41053.1 TonB-dependent receptor [Ignavibacteria bacterium]
MIKKIFILLFCFLLINTSNSQNDKDRKDNRNFKPQFDDGEISGFIYDRQSKTPLEAVAIQLIKVRDSSLYKGTETDINGFFKIEGISQGRYSLSVYSIGYNRNIRTIMMNDPENKKIGLDTIFLTTGVETEEIEVQTDRPFLELKGDKKVFNVGENMNVTGGTALEVLKNIPSVTVDIDDVISLRGGQQIKFFINGRPAVGSISRILDNLPADQISSVEVITNPSAKYEAEGSTGVINIVLKKYDDSGFNGQMNLSSGTGDKYGGGLNLNYKKNSLNFSGSYDYRKRTMDFSTAITRNNFLYTENAFTSQTSSGQFNRSGNNLRGEVEYSISKSDVFNLSARFDDSERKRGNTENLFVYNQSNILTENSVTYNDNSDNDNGYSLGLNYNKYFKDPNESLSGEASYSYEKEYENDNIQTNYIYPDNTLPAVSKIDGNELTGELDLQTDYSRPVGKESKFETGLKYNLRNTNTGSYYYNQNDTTGGFILDSALTDVFSFNENLGAVYAIFGNDKGNFTYNIGLRGEYWNYDIDQTFADISTSRNQFDLFPSVTLTQKLGATEDISLSYSRKVRRPGYRELSPVVRVFSPVFYRVGNPDLNSEFINSFELNFVKFFSTFSVIPSVFYKLTTDKITSYSTLIDSNITLNTSINANKETSYGAEILLNGAFSKSFSLNGSFSYFTQEVSSDTIGTNSNNTFSGRLFANYNLPFDAGIQLTYFYSGKFISTQGEVDPVSSFDLSLRKDFFDKQLSINLRISDIFNTQKFAGSTTTDTYSQQFSRQRESNMGMLSLTYKFGSEDKKKSRKKKRSNSNDNQDNGGDVDF